MNAEYVHIVQLLQGHYRPSPVRKVMIPKCVFQPIVDGISG